MTKAELRREMRQRLRALGSERGEKSRAITAAIAENPGFLGSEHVALFAPLPSEPDVEWLWEKRARRFCLPRIVAGALEFVVVNSLAELVPAAWNPAVRELRSANAAIVAPAEVDLILVPGLAFTRAGQRLGRGGGFYDRYLAQLSARTMKLGLCFDLQIVTTLPSEPHDQRVDALVTESGWREALI